MSLTTPSRADLDAVRTEPDPQSSPWWLKPPAIVLAGGALALLPALSVSSEDFTTRFSVESYVGWGFVSLVLLAVLALLTGIAIASPSHGPVRRTICAADIERPARWFTIAVVLAFLLWIAVSTTRGLTLSGVIAALSGERGASNRNRDAMPPVLVLSVFLHQAPIAAALNGVLIAISAARKRAPAKRRLMLLIVLGVCWSFLNSERLALFTMLIAAFVSYVLARLTHPAAQRFSASGRRKLALVPLLVPAILVMMFGLFEVSRSWTARASQEPGIVSYSTERLIGYYATASNNAARLVDDELPLLQVPRSGSPGLQLLDVAPISSILPGPEPGTPRFGDVLRSDLNPEFNNPGGFTTPFLALGIIGGIAVWVAIGFGAARCYGRARSGDLLGLLLYPLFMIAIVEAPRVFLFGGVRGLAPLLGGLYVARRLASRPAAESGPT